MLILPLVCTLFSVHAVNAPSIAALKAIAAVVMGSMPLLMLRRAASRFGHSAVRLLAASAHVWVGVGARSIRFLDRWENFKDIVRQD